METVFELQRDSMYLEDTLHSTLWNLNSLRGLMEHSNADTIQDYIAMILAPLLSDVQDNLSKISEALETFAGGRLIIKKNMAGKYVAERVEPKTD